MENEKNQIRDNATEILFLRQALQAQRVNETLGTPVQRCNVSHSHWCRDCNRTWTCKPVDMSCDDARHEIEHHGCEEQQERIAKVIAVLNSPDKWTLPYLSRYAKPKKPGSIASKIAANTAEIARLRAQLGR